MSYIIRDHFMDKFEEKKNYIKKVVDFLRLSPYNGVKRK